MADMMTGGWRQGGAKLEPRQIISRVKRVFENVAETYNKRTAFAYNHFLWSGQISLLPLLNKNFTIENLKSIIEESPYSGFNAEGEKVKRSLVEHLFATHETGYIIDNICEYLDITCAVERDMIAKSLEEKLG